MGFDPVSILAIGSLVLGGVGAGVSYYGQQQSARTQSQFGLMNAQAQAQASQLQGRQQMLQAEMQAAAARASASSAANNAAAMRDQTEAESRVSHENLKRSRLEFENTLAAMRAQGGASGILETTGSPLDFLVRAAEDQQMFEAEQHWTTENDRRAGFRRAEVEQMQGSQLALNANLHTLEGMGALAAGRLGASQARMDGYAAQAVAQGARLSAAGGLASNLGQLGTTGVSLFQNRTPRTATGTGIRR